jgi:hypothetical protein
LRGAEARSLSDCFDREQETTRLVEVYEHVVGWFARRAESEPVEDHSDDLFVELCLRQPANRHKTTAADLKHRLLDGRPHPTPDELLAHYRRLDAIFQVSVTSSSASVTRACRMPRTRR